MQGVEAVRAVLEATPATPSYIISIREHKIERTPLMDAVNLTKTVTQAIGNQDFARAMELRDPEFKAYHSSYINVTTPNHPKMLLPEQEVCD